MKPKLTIDGDGTKRWLLPNGLGHRGDGPAIEYTNGDEIWLINGKKHREDGPAVELIDGRKYWFINNVEYTKMEFKLKARIIKLKKLLK
jgi:hypothetical protein